MMVVLGSGLRLTKRSGSSQESRMQRGVHISTGVELRACGIACVLVCPGLSLCTCVRECGGYVWSIRALEHGKLHVYSATYGCLHIPTLPHL